MSESASIHSSLVEAQGYIKVEGLERFRQICREISAEAIAGGESPGLKAARRALAKALRKAKAEGITSIGAKIHNNRRHAEKALRTEQYSKKSATIGARATIMRKARRNGGASSSRMPPPRKDGKKREWSTRTKQLYGYQGEDAQFILYWLTAGTRDRQAGLGRSTRFGRYGTASTSEARKRYFGGTHRTGSIEKGTLKPELVKLLERVINNEFIPDLDKQWQEIANK